MEANFIFKTYYSSKTSYHLNQLFNSRIIRASNSTTENGFVK